MKLLDPPAPATQQVPTSEGRPGPMRVVHIDIAKPVPDLSRGLAENGQPYQAAWVFARRDDVPVGHVVIPFDDGPVTSERVLASLRAATGDDLVAGSTRPPSPPESALPFTTVVVTTLFARPMLLKRCLSALLRQDYPAFEVIVVDNRPGEQNTRPRPFLTDDPRVRVVGEPRPGISAARNRGIALASGTIIAFTDDDAEAEPAWLRELAGRLLAEPDADAVKGIAVPSELETSAQVLFQLNRVDHSMSSYRRALYHTVARSQPHATRLAKSRFQVIDRLAADVCTPTSLYATGNFGGGLNMAFRTTTLQSLGGFDEALGIGTLTYGGEDLSAFVNLLFAGGCLAFEPNAIVRHSHRRTHAELKHQIFGYGVGLTAMFAALVHTDRRHLVGLLGVARRSVLAIGGRLRRKDSGGSVRFPDDISRAELLGMLKGPFAYHRSRLSMRRRRT